MYKRSIKRYGQITLIRNIWQNQTKSLIDKYANFGDILRLMEKIHPKMGCQTTKKINGKVITDRRTCKSV